MDRADESNPTFSNYSAALMVACTAIALCWANIDGWPLSYSKVFDHSVRLLPSFGLVGEPGIQTVRDWIKDGLMAIFFFVIGLELANEFRHGSLNHHKAALLPIVAAIGGMIVPAAIYAVINTIDTPLLGGARDLGGAAIPVATDIAFAVAALAVVGRRLPPSLRVFLLTLAVADDLGAVALIAVFYPLSTALQYEPLYIGIGVLAAMWMFRRLPAWIYGLAALAVWACAFYAGLNTSLAAVFAAFLVPTAQGLVLRGRLQWLSDNIVLPAFALSAAGVSLKLQLLQALWSCVPIGIALGLIIGKPLGVIFTALGLRKLNLAEMPAGATMWEFGGVACLCGIGFTMSLFIAALAFAHNSSTHDLARLGVMLGSLLSMAVGGIVLHIARKKKAADPKTA